MVEDHHRFMRMAIEEAAKAGEGGNRAVGAVIVRGGEVVARGGNCRESAVDPLGHAETSALRNMVAATGSLDFSKQLLEQAGVAVAAGIGYGEEGEGFVRIAMVENEQRIRQAARNIKRFLQRTNA